MNKQIFKVAIVATVAMLLPLFSHAQGVASDIHSLQGVLNNLYDQMIPLCSRMIDVGRGIAGFAAMWYIAVRVWRHIAAAEPVDFYPLLRPFVIGFCILMFPMVLSLINGVLQPTVTATAAMVGDSNRAIEVMLTPDPQSSTTDPGLSSLNNDPAKWYQYTHPDNPSGPAPTTANPIADQFSGWGFASMIKKMMYEFLNVCFEAAALVIDTIRTFKLIVLAILGPLAFGLGVFDGFQHTIKQWLARYINVFMWLPVANIFGAIISKIQQNMTQVQLAGGSGNHGVVETNTAYLIFLLIGIIGYFTVPSIANYIISAGGHALLGKTTAITSAVVSAGTSVAMQSMVAGAGAKGDAGASGSANTNTSSSAGGSNAGNYMQDKLSGKT